MTYESLRWSTTTNLVLMALLITFDTISHLDQVQWLGVRRYCFAMVLLLSPWLISDRFGEEMKRDQTLHLMIQVSQCSSLISAWNCWVRSFDNKECGIVNMLMIAIYTFPFKCHLSADWTLWESRWRLTESNSLDFWPLELVMCLLWLLAGEQCRGSFGLVALAGKTGETCG